MPNRDLPVSDMQVLALDVEVAFAEAALVTEVRGLKLLARLPLAFASVAVGTGGRYGGDLWPMWSTRPNDSSRETLLRSGGTRRVSRPTEVRQREPGGRLSRLAFTGDAGDA